MPAQNLFKITKKEKHSLLKYIFTLKFNSLKSKREDVFFYKAARQKKHLQQKTWVSKKKIDN